ncbi:hypothetical protein [Natranaerobius thermophilus]|uniref:hypothetical protein n=1 Tax=Natranaerobius thermophilus TaxID=375929 RepID=UPI0002EA50DF|nr:hypothetical protein [Natranaerobius thermophilus]
MEFVLWFLAAYGFLNLIYNIWCDITSRRAWTFVVFVSDPDKAEGELRSFLAECPGYKSLPHKVVLIWNYQDNQLRDQLQREFPGVEFVEYLGDRTLDEVFHDNDPGRIVVLEC